MSRILPIRWRATSMQAVITTVAAMICTLNVGAQTTTATLRGYVTVFHEPGKSVPGATITASNNASGFVHKALSRPDGSYNLSLDPATYTITVTVPGYMATRKTVRVQVGQSLDLDLIVVPESVGTAVVAVTATQDLVEAKSAEVATNVTTEQIEQLPQGNRNFFNFAALAPGISVSTDEQNKNFRATGQEANKTNIYIDGASYKNDILEGGSVGSDSSRGNPFPLGAIQEFRVLTQNFKAEYQKASSAIISAVTKSGGNEFQGQVFAFYQNDHLRAQDPYFDYGTNSFKFDAQKPEFSRTQVGFSVGGPIIKDKLHFFVSYEKNKQNGNNTVRLGSDQNEPEWTAAAAAPLRALLTSKLGTFSAPFESDLFYGKLNFQVSTNQDLEFTANIRDEKEIRDFGGATAYENATNYRNSVDTFSLKDKYSSATWVNEAMVSYQKFNWNPRANAPGQPQIDYNGMLVIGQHSSTQDITQERTSFRDDFSYVGISSHSIKVGGNIDFLKYKVQKADNINPRYEDWWGGIRFWGAPADFSVPNAAYIGIGNPNVDASNNQIGWYIQDDWNVTPRLQINAGLRWDYESDMFDTSYVTPADVRAGLQGKLSSNYFTDGNQRKQFYGAFQPRLGFSYDVSGNQKTVVFGGFGRYYDREVYNRVLDEKMKRQWATYKIIFTADGRNQDSNPALKWDPIYWTKAGLLGVVSSGKAGLPEAWLMDNDTKPTYSDQLSLGVRQTVQNTNLSLTLTQTRSYNNLTWIFARDAAGNQLNGTIPGSSAILISTDDKKTWYQAMYLQVDRPYSEASGWGAGLAYTLSWSKMTGAIGEFNFDKATPNAYGWNYQEGDERHRVVANAMVKVPFGFRLATVITLGSGPAYTINDNSRDTAHNGVQSVRLYGQGHPGNRKEFLIPGVKWAYRNVDLRLQKDIDLPRKTRLGISIEATNVLNTWNYQNYDATINPSNDSPNPRYGMPTGVGPMRRAQVGLTFTF